MGTGTGTSLDSLGEILKLFSGNSGGSTSSQTTVKSGGTATKQTAISADLATQMLQNALESNQGLANVAQGQAGAGMYNSTTNKLLTNDLLARLTSNIAEKAAPTTETVSPSSQTTGTKQQNTVPSLKGQLPNMAALTLAKPVLDKIGKTKTVSDLLQGVSDFFSPESSSVIPAAADTIATNLSGAVTPANSFADILGYNTPQVTSSIAAPLVSDVATTALESSAADAITSAAFGSEAGLGVTATEAAIDAGILGGGEAIAGAAAGLGVTATEAAIDAGILGGGAAAGAAAGLGVTATEAAIDAGILGGGAAAGGSLLAEALPLVLGWVICTELQDSGELPYELYKAGAIRTLVLSEEVIRGYQWWAIPYTRWMRKSNAARNFIKPLALARASYLATGKFNFFGWLSVVIGEPICYLLGKTVARKNQDWESLYVG